MGPTIVVEAAKPKDDYDAPIPALTFSVPVEDEMTADELPFHSEEDGRIVAKAAGVYVCRLTIDPHIFFHITFDNI